jgi:hypothetical protein
MNFCSRGLAWLCVQEDADSAELGAPRPMKMGTYMRLLQSRGFLLELRFLASQEAWVCIHGMVVPLLGRAFAVKPQRPQGCAFWRKGLTAKARAER